MSDMKQSTTNEHVSTLLGGDATRLANRVEEILGRQIELFESLEEMSRGQRELIDARSTEALLALLSRRSNVIHRLDRVGSEFAPFKARWSEVMQKVTGDDKSRINDRLAQLEAVAERVAKRDEADRAVLAGARDEAAKELASVKQGSAAVAAYGSRQERSTPRFHDGEG